jgi:hypothetical protein
VALARVLSTRGEHAAAEQLAREAVVLVEPIDLLLVKALVFDALGGVLARAGKVGESASAYERATRCTSRRAMSSRPLASDIELAELQPVRS